MTLERPARVVLAEGSDMFGSFLKVLCSDLDNPLAKEIVLGISVAKNIFCGRFIYYLTV